MMAMETVQEILNKLVEHEFSQVDHSQKPIPVEVSEDLAEDIKKMQEELSGVMKNGEFPSDDLSFMLKEGVKVVDDFFDDEDEEPAAPEALLAKEDKK